MTVIAPVKVLVDSTAGIRSELANAWGVRVIPLYLRWAEHTYRDGVDTLPTSFYVQLVNSPSNPKTSAPSPADFTAACNGAFADGHQQVLIVTVTPTMSGTFEHANLAAQDFGSDKVSVLDSGQGAGAQALIAAYAARLAQQGARLPEVVAAAEAIRPCTEIFMAVDTLRYLHRSGRISATQAVLGEVIQMKPILTFVNHRLQVIAKPRTMRHAARWLLDRLTVSAQVAVQVLVMHANTPEAAAQFAEQIRGRLPCVELDISPVSDVVGAHTGPGLLGLAVRWRS